MAVALRKLYPTEWKIDNYLRLLANTEVLEGLKRGDAASEIVRSWSEGLGEFRKARAQVLIYQ
jgi:hypothetical protein